MIAKLRGVRASMDKLKFNLEADADKLAARVETTDQNRVETFKGAHATMDSIDHDIKDVGSLLDEIKKSNAAPTSGDSSEESSNVVVHPRSSEVAQR